MTGFSPAGELPDWEMDNTERENTRVLGCRIKRGMFGDRLLDMPADAARTCIALNALESRISDLEECEE